MLSQDNREKYVQAVFSEFEKVCPNVRMAYSSAEYELARRWAVRGLPLPTVLQGIRETTRPRTLFACERAVEENAERQHKAIGSLTELPKPGPLLDAPEEPFDVEAARRRRDEWLAVRWRTG